MTDRLYSLAVSTDLGYDEARDAALEAFKEQGFGLLTEIDVRATLKEKLGVDFKHYVILGMCNPQLAYRALQLEDGRVDGRAAAVAQPPDQLHGQVRRQAEAHVQPVVAVEVHGIELELPADP